MRDQIGIIIDRHPYAVRHVGVLGQGYPLASYRPLNAMYIDQFIQLTFTPACERDSPAVAEVINLARTQRTAFPFSVDSNIGLESAQQHNHLGVGVWRNERDEW